MCASWAVAHRFNRHLERTVKGIWKLTLGRHIFVKRVRYRQKDVEAATMAFVRKRTTIPVPRVWAVVLFRGSQYIFMTRLAGEDIGNTFIWEEDFPSTKREHIIAQLRGYLEQLRAIGPPLEHPPLICNVLGGPILDHRLSTTGPYGPYRDEEQMNLQIRQGLSVDDFARRFKRDDIERERIRQSHDLRHPIVFTHNDIAPRNIMVDGDRVTGIIDWECAGWMPAHWEYLKAKWLEHHPDGGWANDLQDFIPPYDFESFVDQRCVGWSRDWVGRLDL